MLTSSDRPVYGRPHERDCACDVCASRKAEVTAAHQQLRERLKEPIYRIPRHLLSRHEQGGLTVGEAKALARDIRIWLIGQGHETVDEFEEP